MPDLTYPNVQRLIASQMRRHSTESRAFLAWVFENVYRLDETHADDCVCDGPDDNGIDGIYVNHESTTVEIFQSKLYQNANKMVGDAALRDFVGALAQVQNPDAIKKLRDSTKNLELQGRIDELVLPDLVAQNYAVKGVFVTNGTIDANGDRFLGRNLNISTLDKKTIDILYVSAERERPETGEFEFDVTRYGVITFVNPQGTDVALAPIPATQLVRLPGIDSGALFEPNLRQSLGRTKVNKEILDSIADVGEHGQFLLYHNGITMVSEELSAKDGKLKVRNFYVVNGCQSLSSLYEKKDKVTNDLCVFTKIVKVGRNSDLIDKITHRSNNQNAIKARDFKSNHPIQTRLQNEFNAQFGGSVFYQIKRGEKTNAATIIDNELAAKLLLAFDLRQPYTAHQTYKLFDDLYGEIFSRREVNAVRIEVIFIIYQKVVAALEKIENKSLANYKLTEFLVLHLVAEALRSSEAGKVFLQDPTKFVQQANGFKILGVCVDRLLGDLITDLNGELRDRQESGNPIDFKRELKSASAVGTLARAVVGAYQKLVGRGRVESFDSEWNKVAADLGGGDKGGGRVA